MKTIHIGLLGFGTVGAGVARILLENADLLRARTGIDLRLKHVADLDLTTDRGVALADGVLINDSQAVVTDPQIDIIVEMIGGQTIAATLIEAAIANGKHVVTANKALLASQGNRLMAMARQRGVDLAYEASVGGCMPIIKTIRESLVGNRISAMTGILNGTCNYILTRITNEGSEFAPVLADAQAQGYAEADPTLDIEGIDTAHKLAILTALAFGMRINLDDIYVEGITRITPLDIAMAEQFGYRIKLLAIGKQSNGRVEARIHPTMIPMGNQLAKVNGTLNAVTVTGDAVDHVTLFGHGAGRMPTGSAVVGDIVDIARNIVSGSAGRIPVLGYQDDQIRDIPVMPMDDVVTHYYIRFAVLDQPGVLSVIAGVLGRHGISIRTVLQKGRHDQGAVPIVMLTHRAKEAAIKLALAEINALDVVTDPPMLIRIEDNNATD